MSFRPTLVVVAALGASFACAPSAEKAPVTYGTTIKGIIDARCAGCHHEGGIGPMPLTTYAEIEPFLDVMEADVRSGNMPPWPAADDCNEYANDFSLTDGEKSALLGWFEHGAPEGSPQGAAEQAVAAQQDPRASGIRVDAVIETSGAFVPTRADQYRCYAMPWPYDHDVYVTGFDMLPGDPTNVHHVNVFVNPPAAAEEFLGYEAEDNEAGYSCSRGSSVDFPTLLGSWAPGASGMAYPEGTGQLVEVGSVVTMQIHYGGAGGEDWSSLALEVEDEVERRAVAAPFWWFGHWDDGGMLIPRGERATHSVEMNTGLELAALAPWFRSEWAELHLVALHMHGRGAAGTMAIHSPVGDTCLLEIPAWDFHRQMGYALKKPVEVYLSEDRLFLSCTFDNTDGTRDVNWGDGTEDEMCIGFAYFVPLE